VSLTLVIQTITLITAWVDSYMLTTALGFMTGWRIMDFLEHHMNNRRAEHDTMKRPDDDMLIYTTVFGDKLRELVERCRMFGLVELKELFSALLMVIPLKSAYLYSLLFTVGVSVLTPIMFGFSIWSVAAPLIVTLAFLSFTALALDVALIFVENEASHRVIRGDVTVDGRPNQSGLFRMFYTLSSVGLVLSIPIMIIPYVVIPSITPLIAVQAVALVFIRKLMLLPGEASLHDALILYKAVSLPAFMALLLWLFIGNHCIVPLLNILAIVVKVLMLS